MSTRYKVMCGCECCISAKTIHSSLLSWRYRYLKKLKYLSQNSQNRRYDEMDNHLFETYKNSVIPHGLHIYETSSDMAMAIVCAYPPSQHAFPHWKCVLHCCSHFPYIDLPDQWSDRYHSNTSTSILFHIYHLIACFILHGRRPLDENIIFHLC